MERSDKGFWRHFVGQNRKWLKIIDFRDESRDTVRQFGAVVGAAESSLLLLARFSVACSSRDLPWRERFWEWWQRFHLAGGIARGFRKAFLTSARISRLRVAIIAKHLFNK